MTETTSDKKAILITGAGSGFGLLTTQTLLSSGYEVVATMRDVEGRNAPVAEEIRASAANGPGTVHLLELDVTDDASVEAAVTSALDLTNGLDVVINNAGIGVGGLAEAFTVDQYRQIFDINVLGVQRVNRAVLPSLRKAGQGLLIHVSSVMGRVVLPFSAPYTASKWALEGLVESYRYELSSTGVDVAIVEPGGFGTGFGGRMLSPADTETVADYGAVADIPERMWGGFMEHLQSDEAPDPQEVADAIQRLIETPAGERPLRVVVDPMTGGEAPRALNQASDAIQREILEGLGMPGLLSVEPESRGTGG